MGAIRLLAAALALLVVVSPAQANGGLRSPAQLSQQQDMERVVACLLKTKRKIMVTLVFDENSLIGKKFTSMCLESDEYRRLMRKGIDSDFMSGVTAEKLLKTVDLTVVEALIPAAPAIEREGELSVADLNVGRGVSEEAKIAWVDKVNWQRSVDVLAECAVRKAAGLSKDIFFADFGSSEEAESMERLKPVMTACLGAEVPSPMVQAIRPYLAINYAKLAAASDPSFKANLE